jgi:hypothetical protein
MTNPGKPFSQSCENNKNPILQILRQVFTQPITVWEIGSGSGQHACYFAEQLPHIIWQPTDKAEYLPGIQLWLNEANLNNLMPPLQLDINQSDWPCQAVDGVFTANTLHIISLAEVETLFKRMAVLLSPAAKVCIYGPFNYQGSFTSDSNQRFDQWLKDRDPLSGIRDFEYICKLANAIGLELQYDHSMPANNRLLVFQSFGN